jgi:hypothetical protein
MPLTPMLRVFARRVSWPPMSALIDILCRGGCYWPRPPNGPGRALAIPDGGRFRIALPPNGGPQDESAPGNARPDERPSGGPAGKPARGKRKTAKVESAPAPESGVTYVRGVCRNGVFVLDPPADHAAGRGARPRVCETVEAAVRAAGASADPFDCIEFLVGLRWMTADALRRSGAMPWGEVDEIALSIAMEAVRDKAKDEGETLSAPVVTRKAAEAVASFSYFLDEAKERLAWMK